MQPGITGFREALAGLPGAENLLMRYEGGGAVQVFFIGDVTVRLGPMASHDEVRDAFVAEFEKRRPGGG